MKQRAIRPGQIGLLLAIAFVYVTAWFAHFGGIPAGQYPDEATQATLDTARVIADGSLAAEDSPAAYSLYTGTLSLFAHFAETDAGIITAARAVNALALLWVTAICASAASRYWENNRSVWLSGLLVGLNPVLVFWAGEISPALLAAACMSSAIAYLLPWFKDTKARSSCLIALALTLASALQTPLLPFALLWPLFAFLYPIHRKALHLGVSLAPPLALCILISATNLSLQTPWQWAFGSIAELAQQAHAALANPEIPGGKSFALYRELHLLLFLNPIHWGALFILAGAGFYVRLKKHAWSPSILTVLAMLLLFAFSFALNDGGSQTRASLIPVLALFAAGAYQIPRLWHRAQQPGRLSIILGGAVLAAFSYATNFTTDPSSQWESDYAYLARANLAMGQNDRATTWAKKALEISPERPDMQEVLVLAQFKDWALSNQPRTLPAETTREYLIATKSVQTTSTLRTIRAIYYYKLRETQSALATWEAEKETCPLAMLCLYWTGNSQEPDPGKLQAYAASPYRELLIEALQIDRKALEYSDLEKQIDNLLAPAY
jgi:hypothetical protein